jgi:TPR repeat protein
MTREHAKPEDYAEAARLLHEAAREGLEQAKLTLASTWDDAEFAAKIRKAGKRAIHVDPQGTQAGFPSNAEEALAWLLSAAANDHVESQLLLVDWYEEGVHVEKSDREAIRWLRAASKLQSSEARFRLARRLEKGNGLPQDPRAAFELYEDAAHDEHPAAAYAVGRHYRDGIVVKKSHAEARRYFRTAAVSGDIRALSELAAIAEEENRPDEARELYERAAKAGNYVAAYNLAQMYRFGKGIDPDPVEAERWYRKAAGHGDADAMRQLAHMLVDLGRGGESVFWFKRGAEGGDARCAAALADVYRFGKGVPEDFDAALTWMRSAASRGHLRAEYLIGQMLLERGRKADVEESIECLTRAADHKVADANVTLGLMHFDGIHFKRDLAKAKRYLSLAVDQDSTLAMITLGRILLSESSEAGHRDAVELFRRAADREPIAALLLGFCYRDGTGVEKNRFEGARWIEVARATGDEEVMAMLGPR